MRAHDPRADTGTSTTHDRSSSHRLPRSAGATGLLALQRAAGNMAVTRAIQAQRQGHAGIRDVLPSTAHSSLIAGAAPHPGGPAPPIRTWTGQDVQRAPLAAPADSSGGRADSTSHDEDAEGTEPHATHTAAHVAARTPTDSAESVARALAPQVGVVLREIGGNAGTGLRELELRMFDPENVVVTLMVHREWGGKPLAEGYRWMTENFPSICGETVNLLRKFTFPPDAPQRRCNTLAEVIDELRRPEDANLDIRCHGHAFFVEKRQGTCHILQSYIGRYALADSLEGAEHAGVGSISAADFAESLQQIGAHHRENRERGRPFQTHAKEKRLFGGALFNEKDVENDHVNLVCESTTDIRTAAEQRMRINKQLAKFADRWEKVKKFQGTPAQFLFPESS